jgi:hypothetical protein
MWLKHRIRIWVWGTGLGWALALGSVSAAPMPASACDYLRDRMSRMPPGPVLLASYPTVRSGPLNNAAYTYDNAVSAIALVACGKPEQARRIGDALLLALDHDRFWHDGRIRNAYAAGAIAGGPLKLPGWWDAPTSRWLEDGYQAGSDSGNIAWAMLALLTLDALGPDARYRIGAARLAHWVEGRIDTRGRGGFTGGDLGHEPSPQSQQWKSTEHNTDLAAAFHWLADASGDRHWQQGADEAERFVAAMWDPQAGRFAVGTAEDGVHLNPLLALDAQIWPLLALPGTHDQYLAALSTVQARLRFGAGYTYSEAGGGLWAEGTSQVAVLMKLLRRDESARAADAAIQALRTDDGGYYASDVPATPTGFMLATDPSKPRVYFHLEHLGATAWAALSQQRYNPFVGGSDLP